MDWITFNPQHYMHSFTQHWLEWNGVMKNNCKVQNFKKVKIMLNNVHLLSSCWHTSRWFKSTACISLLSLHERFILWLSLHVFFSPRSHQGQRWNTPCFCLTQSSSVSYPFQPPISHTAFPSCSLTCVCSLKPSACSELNLKCQSYQ